MQLITLLFAIGLLALYCPGCGKAKASGVHAEIIPAPDSSTCYAIVDDNGDVKGGNCK